MVQAVENMMAVENMQGDAKVSSANEHRKTSAGASQARSKTRPLQNQRTEQGLGTFLSRRVRGVALPLSDKRVWKALERRTVAHIRRACPTISTRTFLASAGLLTSRKNAMRVPRVPSWVFKRT